MNTLYVMCGILGSGKTTLAKQIEESYRAKRHSYDEFPNARGNADRDGNIKRRYWEEILHDIKRGFDVVCDDANILVEDRMYIFDKLSDIECRKILVIVDTPVDECIRRNAQRQGVERVREFQIHLTAMMMEKPVNGEPWDEIYEHKG